MTDARKASDEMLLEMIRSGRHDAEIAVRLGITTGDLRARKADLRARLGDVRYYQLTGGAAAVASRKRFAMWGAAIAAGLFVALLAVANIVDRTAEDVPPVAGSSGVATIAPRELQPVSVESIGGQEFIGLGTFIHLSEPASDGIGTISNRAALSAVTLRRQSYIGSSEFVEWEVVSSSRTDAFLRGTVDDRQLDLAVYTQRPEGRLRRLASGIGLLFEVEALTGYPKQPTILVRVSESGRPVEARLTARGELLVAVGPLDASEVIDSSTGTRLDVSGAAQFGSLAISQSGHAQNVCDGPPLNPNEATALLQCQVVWSRGNRGFIAPVAGTYSCTGARSVRFEAEGTRLEFILSGVNPTANFACEPRAVAAGTSVVPDGEWFVSAVGSDGKRVPLAVSGDGRLYAGAIRGNVECPCVGGQ